MLVLILALVLVLALALALSHRRRTGLGRGLGRGLEPGLPPGLELPGWPAELPRAPRAPRVPWHRERGKGRPTVHLTRTGISTDPAAAQSSCTTPVGNEVVHKTLKPGTAGFPGTVGCPAWPITAGTQNRLPYCLPG